MSMSYFNVFEESVKNLSEKLPQWNSNDKERTIMSAVSSLLEEAGEISGLISKKRVRKSYWKTEPKSLDDFYEIRNKFIDEVGDFLWVLVCSIQCLTKNKIDIEKKLCEDKHNYDVTFEIALFDVISDIITLQQHLMFNGNDEEDFILIEDFEFLLESFNAFLSCLNKEYDIGLNKLCEHNMKKLNIRYTKDGKRIDEE